MQLILYHIDICNSVLCYPQEDIDKETVGTTTTLEDSASQITDKIGEKLSKHSKHNSFIYAESTMSKLCICTVIILLDSNHIVQIDFTVCLLI